MDLLNVISVEAAENLLIKNFSDYRLNTESVIISEAAGRFLASDQVSAVTVPSFRRSTKDGYAVRSVDVSGASETLPAFLMLAGEVNMGTVADYKLKPGEAAYVPTGGMVPDGADSVVMIEYSEKLTDDEVSIYRPTAVNENIINIGDDIEEGCTVMEQGRKLKPADLGVLTSIGLTEVEVFVKPAVSVISTGDEIAGPDEDIKPGQIRDINTYTIAAAAEALGCRIIERVVVKDDQQLLTEVLRECYAKSDIVLLSGGSSVGVKDYSLQVIDSLGAPGVLCHGIAFKPGKPTIIANAGGKPVIGLPGHPVSALVVFGILGRTLVHLMYRTVPPVESWVEAVLSENVNGAAGREAWQMVRLAKSSTGYEAVPVHGESGLITMLASSFGTVRIPLNKEGLSKGSSVRVYPL